MTQLKKLFVVVIALSVAILGGCTIKPGSADDGLTVSGDPVGSGGLSDSGVVIEDNLPESSIEAGITITPIPANNLHSGGNNYLYEGHEIFIGYTDSGQDILGNIKTLYGFEQIEQVALETGYVYFVADGLSYRYDFAQQGIFLSGDDSGYTVPYHTVTQPITQAELDSGSTYLLTGPRIVRDQEVAEISVMWNNRPVNSYVPVEYETPESTGWTYTLELAPRMLNTGLNEFVVVYSPDTGNSIGVDGYRVIYELTE